MTNQDEKLMTSITNSMNELDEKLCKLDSLLKPSTKDVSTKKEGHKGVKLVVYNAHEDENKGTLLQQLDEDKVIFSLSSMDAYY